MKDFLEAHGSEVANMLLSGWNMDEALAVLSGASMVSEPDTVEYKAEWNLNNKSKAGV